MDGLVNGRSETGKERVDCNFGAEERGAIGFGDGNVVLPQVDENEGEGELGSHVSPLAGITLRMAGLSSCLPEFGGAKGDLA